MAISKSIRQSDGVTTSYHRILFVQKMTNNHNAIAVLSYVDQAARNEELSGEIAIPYIKSVTYNTAYDENMTISTAYDYLKTLEVFEGATDI